MNRVAVDLRWLSDMHVTLLLGRARIAADTAMGDASAAAHVGK